MDTQQEEKVVNKEKPVENQGDEGQQVSQNSDEVSTGLILQLKEQVDRNFRLAAEFENYKKRVRKDIEDSNFHVTEKLLREFFPVMDNLERALDTIPSDDKTGVLEGIKLVQRMFFAALEKFEIRPFGQVGEMFDPKLHEAVSQVESSSPAGTIASIYQKGYLMKERVLRAAMVSVAKSA